MTRRLTSFLGTAAVLGGLALAPLALAEESTPAPQEPSGPGMIGGGMGMGSMMNPDQMRQMSEMVSNCNRMMEAQLGTWSKGKAAPGGKNRTQRHDPLYANSMYPASSPAAISSRYGLKWSYGIQGHLENFRIPATYRCLPWYCASDEKRATARAAARTSSSCGE